MSITITTWNVQNFSKNNPIFNEKLDYLANTIQLLNSNVVALQEVLDIDAVKNLASKLNFHCYFAQSDHRGNRVAIISQIEADSSKDLDNWIIPHGEKVQKINSQGAIEIEVKFPRPALEVAIPYNGKTLKVITAHMKSKLLTFKGKFSTTNETLRAQTAFFALQRRSAEATSLREHISGLLTNGEYVVLLGDFNDVHHAATTQVLFGPTGSQPRGPEDATKLTCAFQRSDNGDQQRMFNVTNFVPKDFRWSRKHKGEEELLDHILACAKVMPRGSNGLRQVPSVSILNDETPNLISVNPNNGDVIPDHAPVTATFI